MWFAALENPNTVIGIVFLDFSKAFDLIDHNILLKDFKDVGVRPALLPWLASYVSDRTQRVKFDGELSNFREVNAGVICKKYMSKMKRTNHPLHALLPKSTDKNCNYELRDKTEEVFMYQDFKFCM
jgi:hypothetical protein